MSAKTAHSLAEPRRALPRQPLQPAEPLWKRVPLKDEEGHLLTDCMLLIPKLGSRPVEEQRAVTDRIQGALQTLGDKVVFADLNLALNVLWVSMKAEAGAVIDVTAAVQAQVPEALLVANQVEMVAARRRPWWRRWRRG
jgi:hypothetical protein